MNGRKHFLSAIAAGLTLCMTTACGSDSTEIGFRNIAAEGWDEADTLSFDIDSIPATGGYALEICLRSTVTPPYPFREISIAVGRQWTGHSQTDTVCLPTHPVRSETQIRGVSLLQYDFPIDTLHLAAGTKLRVTLRHLMRRTPLPGIRDTGVRLKRL